MMRDVIYEKIVDMGVSPRVGEYLKIVHDLEAFYKHGKNYINFSPFFEDYLDEVEEYRMHVAKIDDIEYRIKHEGLPDSRREREKIYREYKEHYDAITLMIWKVLDFIEKGIIPSIENDRDIQIIRKYYSKFRYDVTKFTNISFDKLKDFAKIHAGVYDMFVRIVKYVGSEKDVNYEDIYDKIRSLERKLSTLTIPYIDKYETVIGGYTVILNKFSSKIIIKFDYNEYNPALDDPIPFDEINEFIDNHYDENYDSLFFLEIQFDKDSDVKVIDIPELYRNFELYHLKPVKLRGVVTGRPTKRTRIYSAEVVVGKRKNENGEYEVLTKRVRFLYPQQPVTSTGRKLKIVDGTEVYTTIQIGNISVPVFEKSKLTNEEATLSDIMFVVDEPLIGSMEEGKEYIFSGIPIVYDKSKKNPVVAFFITGIESSMDDVKITEEDIKKFQEFKGDINPILRSFASHIDERTNEEIRRMKLTLLSTIVELPELEGKIRDYRHTLIIGDPSVGKSTLMKELAKITPNSAFVVGGGVSDVGLIGGVMKHPGLEEFVPIPGIVSRAKTLFIDEGQELPKTVLRKLNEVMEHGTSTVSKAGIYHVFPAETKIIMSANPKRGYLHMDEDLHDLLNELDIPPSLASRFDQIIVIRDITEYDRDKNVALSILKTVMKKQEKPPLTLEELTKFIYYVSYNIHVEIPDDVAEYIAEKYAELRQMIQDEKYKPRARNVNSIIRTSMAIAKLHQRDVVTTDDVDLAIELLMHNIQMKKIVETKSQDEINMGTVTKTIIKVTSKKQDKTFNYDEVFDEIINSGSYDIIDVEEVEDVITETIERLEKWGAVTPVGWVLNYEERLKNNEDEVKLKIYRAKIRKLKSILDQSNIGVKPT